MFYLWCRYGGRPSREEALQAVAVINRVRRMLSHISDGIVNRLQRFATALGRAAKCDPWAVEIFAEEVVRGGPAFAVSLVISSVEPPLRSMAELGAWQVWQQKRGREWGGGALRETFDLSEAWRSGGWEPGRGGHRNYG